MAGCREVFQGHHPAPHPCTGGSWEAREQVDLEWFDTETFFGILLRQSLSVTTQLSQTKEEVSGGADDTRGTKHKEPSLSLRNHF